MSSKLLYQNLLSQSTFSAFNVSGAAVAMEPAGWGGAAYPYKVGSATLEARGTYTGVFQADYLVEIQSSTDGSFANTRWRWSDTGGAVWNDSNLTPLDGTWITLNNGLDVRFVSGTAAPQFVEGDYWEGRPIRPHGIVKAFDGSRNSEYRSGTIGDGGTLRIGFDLATASSQQPTFFAMDDQNIPSNDAITIFAHASSLFTESGGFSQAVTWRANRLAEVITTSAYRYWWVKIVFTSAPVLTYFRCSTLFLGTGATFAKEPMIGFSNPRQFLASIDVSNIASRGPSPRIYTAGQLQYTWSGVKQDASEDGGKLDAAMDYAERHPSYTYPPFWFILFDDDLSSARYLSWIGSEISREHVFQDKFNYGVTWTDVIRTVAQ